MTHLQDGKSPAAKPQGEQTPRKARRRLKIATRPEFSEKSRIFVYEMSELFCKILPLYSQQLQNDLAKLLIAHALGASNVQRLMASPQRAPFESMDTFIPPELQVPANALSIADSTGLPRETVRRKLKEMLAAGLVVEDARGGYRLKPGSVQTDELLAIYYTTFKGMAEVMAACIDAGLVELE
jgi:hypothetical protein